MATAGSPGEVSSKKTTTITSVTRARPSPSEPTGAIGKCRTCSKHLTPATGKGTVQRANLFAELRNKEFTTPLKREKLVLNEILTFWGHGISKADRLSHVICLQCARTLVRTYSTQLKFIQHLKGGGKASPAVSTFKRVSQVSPASGRSPLTTVQRKRARFEALNVEGDNGQQQETGSTGQTGKRSLDFGVEPLADDEDKENVDNQYNAENLIDQVKGKISALMEIPGNGTESVVKVFIGYPSGRVTEHECVSTVEKKLLRAIAKKDPGTAVTAIMETKSYQPFLRAKFSKILSREAVKFFKGNSCLKMDKHVSPTKISQFSIATFASDIKGKMPVTFQFLEAMTGIRAGRIKEKKKQEKKIRGKVVVVSKKKEKELKLLHMKKERRSQNTLCNVAAICLKQYFPCMSALAYRNTLLLLNGGCRSLDVDRLKMQGLTMSHSSSIRMQYRMAREFGMDVVEWRKDLETKQNMANLMIDIGKKVFPVESETDTASLQDSDLICDNVAKRCESYNDDIWAKCKSFIEHRHTGDDALKNINSAELLAEEIAAILESIKDYR